MQDWPAVWCQEGDVVCETQPHQISLWEGFQQEKRKVHRETGF